MWVLFSEPVLPLSATNEPVTKSDTMSIEPAVEGVFRWYGSRCLSFEPLGPLNPAVEYTVRIDTDLVSLAGKPLDGPTEFRLFRTHI